jgi:peptidoglycan/xylan/chitin deacetylase (PgdA/CDA1 family)
MKRPILKLLRRGGIFNLTRAMSSGMARILMYHNFSPSVESDRNAVQIDEARAQLEYLRRHFQVVSLSDLVERLASGTALQDRMVALTVDDGRRNFYDCFYLLLREFQMPATFFVVTSFIEGKDWIWTDKVLWLAEQPSRSEDLSPEKIEHLFESLNRMRPEVRDRHIAALASRMQIAIPVHPPAKYAACSWSELREMADSGLVEIGSHTVSHPILSSINDDESRWQLIESRAQIEQKLGIKVKWFCFPNGKSMDYRPSQVQQVKDAGYDGAFVTRFDLVTRTTNVYELPRLGVGGKSDLLAFSKDVDGAAYYQLKIATSLGLRGH